MLEDSVELFKYPLNLEKRRIFTVSEITKDIKLVLETTFGEVWVEGEVSGSNRLPTGTILFNLKDNQSILKCVIFAAYAQAMKFEIKDGLKFICFGHISVYEKEGRYQLYVEKIEPKGVGSLQLAFEQLKQKLEKEGLFSLKHKRQIPYLPSNIGIVTSLQGAAIRDILKVLERRFQDVQIIINSVRVQGEGAKEEISQAIKDFNLFNQQLPAEKKIEVLIVGRGGGSIEDLWAFNEEVVARAIYNSRIPIISAVGHERDWTIADLVADVRCATPSVAAEMVLPKKEELKDKVRDLSKNLKKIFLEITTNLQQDIDELAHHLKLNIEHTLALSVSEYNAIKKKLVLLNPVLRIQLYQTKTLDLARQIQVRMAHLFKLKSSEFTNALEKLSSLSPLNVLSRGYSITFKMPENTIVKGIRLIRRGDTIKTKLHRGEILSQVMKIGKDSLQ